MKIFLSFSKRLSRGFTAIEALMATVLLSIGMVALLTFFNQMSVMTMNDELSLIAARLADEKMEQLLAQKAGQGANGYASLTNETITENITNGGVDYTRQTTISWVQASDLSTVSATDAGYKKISILISWNAGQIQSTRISGVVSNHL